MIIDRFGATYSAAYLFSRHNVVDDYEISRAPVTARVGGMNGAFDFYGSNNYPVQPMIIRKNFSLVGRTGGTVAGTGTISGWGSGSPFYIDGNGTLFLSELAVGDVINVDNCAATVINVASNTFVTVNTNTGLIDGGAFTITRPGATWASVEYAVDALKTATITQGESKLWALRRDAVRVWAYAKCTSLKTAEQFNNVYHLPTSIEFYAREGLWYSESATTTTILHGAPTGVSVPTAGTYKSNVVIDIVSSTGTLTAFTLTNATTGDVITWAGSAAVGKHVIINTSAYTITNDGVGVYAGLTIGANQINWWQLAAGLNSVSVSAVNGGCTAWTMTIVRYDTYL